MKNSTNWPKTLLKKILFNANRTPLINQPLSDPASAEAAQESASPSTRPLPTAEEFESLTRDVLARVEKEAGVAPSHVSVLTHAEVCPTMIHTYVIKKGAAAVRRPLIEG